MKGSVLHMFEERVVRARMLRLSYGIIERVPFDPKVHPGSAKRSGVNGDAICFIIKWFARRVCTKFITPNFRVLQSKRTRRLRCQCRAV